MCLPWLIFIIRATRLGDLFSKDPDVKIILFSVRRRLAFSIESPLFIARIVAWVMFNWNWSTNRSAQQPSLLRESCKSLFPRQLPTTNRAFVILSIIVDYFYIEWAHIVIYIIIRTWIPGPKADERSEKSVRTCALLLKLQSGRPVDSLCQPMIIPKGSTWSSS